MVKKQLRQTWARYVCLTLKERDVLVDVVKVLVRIGCISYW